MVGAEAETQFKAAQASATELRRSKKGIEDLSLEQIEQLRGY